MNTLHFFLHSRSLICHSRENGNPVLSEGRAPTALSRRLFRSLFIFFVSAFCLLTSAFPARAALTVENGCASNITSSNAVLWVTLSDTNSTNTTLTCYYGTGNGGTNTSYWQYSNQWGIATVPTNVSITTTNILSGRTYYYYRWRAIGTTTVWASSSSNFTTLSRQVTNWPDVTTNDITQMVDTNGLFKTPSAAKVIAANNLATNGSMVSIADFANISGRVVIAEGGILTNADNISSMGQLVTNLQGAVTTNLSDQSNTNAGFEGRLTAAESFTNAAAQGAAAYAWGDHTTNTLWPTIALSMTNYVHVPSSTNWLAYDPATRLCSGCITNTGLAALDLSGWSGVNATNPVTWTYPVSVTTNIRVTGSGLDPAVQGDYLFAGIRHSTNYWSSTNGNYIYVSEDISLGPDFWCWYLYKGLEDTPGDDSYFARADDPPIGDYIGGPATTGTPTAVYFNTTNTTTWRAGPDPANPGTWSISQDGTNRYSIYATSNVFLGPIYGNAAGLTNYPESDPDWTADKASYALVTDVQSIGTEVTNNMTGIQNVGEVASNAFAGTQSIGAEVTNNTARLDIMDTNTVTRGGNIMHGPLTNNVGFWGQYFAGDGGGLTNITAEGGLSLSGGIMTGPMTNTSGYYGNGVGLTNITGTLSAAEKATATNALRADGSVAPYAPMNGGGQAWTNIASLQITGGSPALGAALMPTNTLGQLGYVLARSKIVTYNTQTTNTANFSVTTVGFKPCAVVAFSTVYGSETASWGLGDSTGTEACLGQAYNGVMYENSTLARIIVGGGEWNLALTSFDDEGATFGQTKTDTPTTNTISLKLLFIR